MFFYQVFVRIILKFNGSSDKFLFIIKRWSDSG
jgi:hypothetical protein